MKTISCLLFVVVACIGCSRSLPGPSQAEIREGERLEKHEAEAKWLLDSGVVYAGQDVHEFLKLCQPHRVDFSDRYAFVEFYPVPNLCGLSLVAVDGKLVSARRWSCTKSEAWFETISGEEKAAAMAAYEARIFGEGR